MSYVVKRKLFVFASSFDVCQDFGYIHLGGQGTENLSLLAVLTMQNMTFLIGVLQLSHSSL